MPSSLTLCKTEKSSVLFASLRTRGSLALIAKPWEAFPYDLNSQQNVKCTRTLTFGDQFHSIWIKMQQISYQRFKL